MVRPMVKIDTKEIRRAVALGMIEELNGQKINRNMVSREAKIAFQTIHNWITKKHAPSVKHLQRIEKVHRRYCNVVSKK